MNMPNLCETENVKCEEKIIYQVYYLASVQFLWLIAEYDPDQKMAFGFANLNDDLNAEWGDIYIPELLKAGARQVKGWVPRRFSEIKQDEILTELT